MTCGIGPVPPVSVSSENRRSFRSKEQPRLRSGSRPSHLNVVLSKAAHSGPSVCLRARALCPLRVSLASERIAQRAVCSCSPCVAADPPSYRLRSSGAYSSRITWACSKGCGPEFRWLLGSRHPARAGVPALPGDDRAPRTAGRPRAVSCPPLCPRLPRLRPIVHSSVTRCLRSTKMLQSSG